MPFPTDPFEQLHYNMVRAHQTFKLGYSSIIKNLDDPKATTEDLSNFLGYCQAWVTSIAHHHDSEVEPMLNWKYRLFMNLIQEEVVFPVLNQKMDFAPEKEAHEAIHKNLDDLEAVLLEAKADTTKFNATQIKEQLEQMKETLFSHLDEEVEHIKSEELKKAGFNETELKELNQNLEKYAKSQGDPFLLVPFMRAHTAPEFKDFWPPMPWVLRKLVIPYVLAKRYSGYWKYAPYSVS
ncbi:hypothetical protein NP233_g4877 [Leucocoprinus birnbaumii]|uniref:Hemerythrin-like domain-containing protein n=1 Tax=Leucocoprinus birnbaumii TaxID=56174 RepID=A0AAD5YV37_9AGAR|nr:hypothetical protein NP233_g4877 [Leucocoprinus birnbaumii]